MQRKKEAPKSSTKLYEFKRWHVKCVHIYDAVYHANIWLFFDTKYEDFDRYIESTYGCSTGEGEFCEGRCLEITIHKHKKEKNHKVIVIWIEDKNILPTLVHELLHAVFFVLKDKGLRLTDSSDEAYTYYLEYLLDCVLGYLTQKPYKKDAGNKQRKKRRKG